MDKHGLYLEAVRRAELFSGSPLAVNLTLFCSNPGAYHGVPARKLHITAYRLAALVEEEMLQKASASFTKDWTVKCVSYGAGQLTVRMELPHTSSMEMKTARATYALKLLDTVARRVGLTPVPVGAKS